MGKKKNASAAGTSISKDIHDLKALNSDLVKEVAELRKQIEHLRSQLDSSTADRHILDSIERDIPDSNAQITEATYKAESATAELNAMEMPLLPLEQDRVERDLELIIEGSDITQHSEKAKPEKIRKKNWIFYPIAITAIFLVSTSVVSLCKSSKLKK